MEFEYTGVIWIDEADIKEMVRLVEECAMEIEDAIYEVARSWDDCIYYEESYIHEKLIAEIERRVRKDIYGTEE